MFGTILLLLSLELMLMLVRDLLSYLSYWLFILLQFFIYLKKELKLSLFPFQFLFYYLLIIVFLFFKRKVLKNQMQISFVVIVLFLLFLDSSVLSLNITSQNFFISLDFLKTLILLL